MGNKEEVALFRWYQQKIHEYWEAVRKGSTNLRALDKCQREEEKEFIRRWRELR